MDWTRINGVCVCIKWLEVFGHELRAKDLDAKSVHPPPIEKERG